MNFHSLRRREVLGALSVLLASLSFYFSTVVMKLGRLEADISHESYIFARFLFGFMFMAAVFLQRRRLPRSHDTTFLWTRAVTNYASAYFFFLAVQESTVASANILNLTAPVFIAIYALARRSGRDIDGAFACVASFVGIVLVLLPDAQAFGWNSGAGLLSGFFAALAILSLDRARRTNDTETILFYMFGFGTVVSAVLFPERAVQAFDAQGVDFVLLSSVIGVLGQYFLTLGFRYVTPVEGSVIGSTRILFAAFLGPVLVSEPAIGLAGMIGALLIFLSNAYLGWRRLA